MEGQSAIIHCNAGSKRVEMIAGMKGFGPVWFDNDCVANILSLALVPDQCWVTLDTDIGQTFHVHRADGTTREFKRAACNPHTCDTVRQKQTPKSLSVSTMDRQKKQHSALDCWQVEMAHKLHEIMGCPSLEAFMSVMDNSMTKNCPVTRHNMKIAEEMHGPNTNVMKGKSVQRKSGHVDECLWEVAELIFERFRDQVNPVVPNSDTFLIAFC